MSLELSRQTEVSLIDEARKRGVSVEALLQMLMSEGEPKNCAAGSGSSPELPVWHLGCAGFLRRRDFYD